MSREMWPAFLIAGVRAYSIFCCQCICAIRIVFSMGFSLLWSIRELFEQEQR